MRSGKTIDIQAKVGEMEEEGATAAASDASHKTLGVSVQNLTPRIAGETLLLRNRTPCLSQ